MVEQRSEQPVSRAARRRIALDVPLRGRKYLMMLVRVLVF
jgi:hypothetical protein